MKDVSERRPNSVYKPKTSHRLSSQLAQHYDNHNPKEQPTSEDSRAKKFENLVKILKEGRRKKLEYSDLGQHLR